ncbi:MAG: cation:dicarboxylase symporter family transporter, partial [Haliea sp.]|nr:cation:dicarboxylase symporter family transporter [Haliea sp.]
MPLLINLLCFASLCYVLYRLRRRGWPLSRQILAGLVAGGLFGLGLQLAWSGRAEVVADTLQWTGIVGSALVGLLIVTTMIAALQVARADSERGAQIEGFVDTIRLIVLRLVHIVMALTPYGILALIGGVVAQSDAADILNL